MAFGINSRVRDIIGDERAKALLDRHVPGASTHPQLDEALYMTLKEVSWYPESGLTPEKLNALVEDLEALD